MGIVCGSVGRGLRFESSHLQKFIMNKNTFAVEKNKIKKKRPVMGQFKKNI